MSHPDDSHDSLLITLALPTGAHKYKNSKKDEYGSHDREDTT